jgi:ubiquinone/menaquinone biosynthesis C-methylase UbiE
MTEASVFGFETPPRFTPRVFKGIPVTGSRSAEELACKHGASDLATFAMSFPEEAYVIDVGAGLSPFGNEVGAARPDIKWVNFDHSYSDPGILEDASRDAPANVEYVAGDATKLNEEYEPNTFDAVYSYWLMPHISANDPVSAARIVRAMFTVAKIGGLVSVGPRTVDANNPQGKSIRVMNHEGMDVGFLTDRIVTHTQVAESLRHLFQPQYPNRKVTRSPYLNSRRRMVR